MTPGAEADRHGMTDARIDVATPLGEHRQVNRELSWLDFNCRVLGLAEEPGIPLLERTKFCAIVSTNLDEFFQIRVAALRDQIAAGIDEATWDGRTPLQQLTEISAVVGGLVARQETVYLDELRPALAEEGIDVVSWDDLGASDRATLREYYDARIFPVLTPLAVDPAHPFPYISNLALSIAAHVADPDTGERRFVRLKIPDVFPRLAADRRRPFRAVRGGDRSPPPHPVRRHDRRGVGDVPRHPQRRPHARGGRGRRPARGGRARTAPAAVQQGDPARGGRQHQRRAARPARPRARARPPQRVAPPGDDRPQLPDAAARARPPRPQGPRVAARHGRSVARRRGGRPVDASR